MLPYIKIREGYLLFVAALAHGHEFLSQEINKT